MITNVAENQLENHKPGFAAQRISSIDVLRAITMVLMIFVNDFWSLTDIPEGLKHVKRGVDGIGFSDVIFPAFLFIVGLSLPYAIDNRIKKGDTTSDIVQHVFFRTIALLVMGVFLVNGETVNAAAMGIPGWLWYPLSCFCFILIWNTYSVKINKALETILKISGIITLTVLAYYYRGGENGDARFASQWWGILGLIGWAYLAGALVTLFSGNNFYALLSAWIFFCVLSMVNKAGLIPGYIGEYIPNAILGGTLPALTMGGVLTSYVFRYYVKINERWRLTIIFLISSLVLIALSIITRPYWGLAKLGATPAWLFLCSAFTLMAFTLIYWVADVWKKSKWFDIIKPAGTDTLLCYLIPYFAYAIIRITGLKLPDLLLTGGLGLLKSFCFALLCVLVTRSLNRVGFKLKI